VLTEKVEISMARIRVIKLFMRLVGDNAQGQALLSGLDPRGAIEALRANGVRFTDDPEMAETFGNIVSVFSSSETVFRAMKKLSKRGELLLHMDPGARRTNAGQTIFSIPKCAVELDQFVVRRSGDGKLCLSVRVDPEGGHGVDSPFDFLLMSLDTIKRKHERGSRLQETGMQSSESAQKKPRMPLPPVQVRPRNSEGTSVNTTQAAYERILFCLEHDPRFANDSVLAAKAKSAAAAILKRAGAESEGWALLKFGEIVRNPKTNAHVVEAVSLLASRTNDYALAKGLFAISDLLKAADFDSTNRAHLAPICRLIGLLPENENGTVGSGSFLVFSQLQLIFSDEKFEMGALDALNSLREGAPMEEINRALVEIRNSLADNALGEIVLNLTMAEINERGGRQNAQFGQPIVEESSVPRKMVQIGAAPTEQEVRAKIEERITDFGARKAALSALTKLVGKDGFASSDLAIFEQALMRLADSNVSIGALHMLVSEPNFDPGAMMAYVEAISLLKTCNSRTEALAGLRSRLKNFASVSELDAFIKKRQSVRPRAGARQ
jgi:hypothetical protein